jgi:hypothetical protein
LSVAAPASAILFARNTMTTQTEQKSIPPTERGEPLRQIVVGPEEPASSHLGARLRSYFLTGLIVVGPVAITIYVVWWFINLVDTWVKPIIPPQYLPEHYLPSPPICLAARWSATAR